MPIFAIPDATYRFRPRAAINELAECDRLELARVAQDLGVSAADLRVLAARDKTAADLLYRRLGSLRLARPASIQQLCGTFNAAVATAITSNSAYMSLKISRQPQAGRNTAQTNRHWMFLLETRAHNKL